MFLRYRDHDDNGIPLNQIDFQRRPERQLPQQPNWDYDDNGISLNQIDFQQRLQQQQLKQQSKQQQQVLQQPSTNKKKRATQEVEIVDLESISSRKTALGGALGMGLFSANIEQLATILDVPQTCWPVKLEIKFWCLVVSLILQVTFLTQYSTLKFTLRMAFFFVNLGCKHVIVGHFSIKRQNHCKQKEGNESNQYCSHDFGLICNSCECYNHWTEF